MFVSGCHTVSAERVVFTALVRLQYPLPICPSSHNIITFHIVTLRAISNMNAGRFTVPQLVVLHGIVAALVLHGDVAGVVSDGVARDVTTRHTGKFNTVVAPVNGVVSDLNSSVLEHRSCRLSSRDITLPHFRTFARIVVFYTIRRHKDRHNAVVFVGHRDGTAIHRHIAYIAMIGKNAYSPEIHIVHGDVADSDV